MDELAAAEHARGASVPIAFANWPTADPLRHPDEPLRRGGPGRRRRQPRAAHRRPGRAARSPATTPTPTTRTSSATSPALQQTRYDGPAGPVRRLPARARSAHYTATCRCWSPSSACRPRWARAHDGTERPRPGRPHRAGGDAIDADLLRLIKDQGIGGAASCSRWTDEWFKLTWNTMEHQVPGRAPPALARPADQRAVVRPGGDRPGAGRRTRAREMTPETGAVKYVLRRRGRVLRRTSTSRSATGYPARSPRRRHGARPRRRRTTGSPSTGRRARRRPRRTPRRWTRSASTRRQARRPPRTQAADWHLYRLITQPELPPRRPPLPGRVPGRRRPRRGQLGPRPTRTYDSLATWQVDDEHAHRQPADPVVDARAWPTRQLAPRSATGTPAQRVKVDGIGFDFDADGAPPSGWTTPGRPGTTSATPSGRSRARTCSPTRTATPPADRAAVAWRA